MANEFELLISPRAAEDFESIFDYVSIELCNGTAANSLVDEFQKALERVCFMPESCPRVNNEYVNDKNLRKLLVNNYIIFYKINEENQSVEVIRVLYGMMNFKDIL